MGLVHCTALLSNITFFWLVRRLVVRELPGWGSHPPGPGLRGGIGRRSESSGGKEPP